MGTLLLVVGLARVAIGLAYIVTMIWRMVPEPLSTYGLIFNFVVFVLAGLAVAGIASAIRNRNRERKWQAEPGAHRT